jgi:inosine-uridine nucleoside N-ribohydrolase
MKNILIDTDCGVDDAVAVMIALASSELNVLGLTTVNGNVGVEQVTDNVLRLLPFLGRALGPLTNVAIALNLYPELEGLIGEIISMGGAVGKGNVTPYAEFNYYADPESVQVVLESKVPLTVVPWDAAVKMAHSEEEIRALGFGDSEAGKLLLDMHQPLFSYIEKVYGSRAAMFPDPLTMAYVVDPAIAEQVMAGDLAMELADTPRRGASVHRQGRRVKLVMEIDKAGFQSILLRIRNLA